MPLIPAAELAALITTQTGTLPDAVVITHLGAPVSDGQGDFTRGASTTVNTVGRLSDLGRNAIGTLEPAVAQKLGTRVPYRLTLPNATTITTTDRVSVNGKPYEVLAVSSTSFSTAQRCVVAEVT